MVRADLLAAQALWASSLVSMPSHACWFLETHRAGAVFLFPAAFTATVPAHSRCTTGYLLNEASVVPVQSIIWLTRGPPGLQPCLPICFLDVFTGRCTFNTPGAAERRSAPISHLGAWEPPPSGCSGQDPQSPCGHPLFSRHMFIQDTVALSSAFKTDQEGSGFSPPCLLSLSYSLAWTILASTLFPTKEHSNALARAVLEHKSDDVTPARTPPPHCEGPGAPRGLGGLALTTLFIPGSLCFLRHARHTPNWPVSCFPRYTRG